MDDNIERWCVPHQLPERYVADPYDEDIHGEINMKWLCEECYDVIADEI